MWAWRRLQPPAACLGTRCRPLRLRSPAHARELGNTLGVGRVANGADRRGRGAQGTPENCGRRARPYDKPHRACRRIQPVPAAARPCAGAGSSKRSVSAPFSAVAGIRPEASAGRKRLVQVIRDEDERRASCAYMESIIRRSGSALAALM